MCRFENPRNPSAGTTVFMKAIDSVQEKTIDRRGYINIEGQTVTRAQIYAYGEIDVNNESHVRIIHDLNLVDSPDGSNMHGNFKYNEGIAHPIEVIDGLIIREQYVFYPTHNPVDWFKYQHCKLGKPKRVIIYKGY